MDKYEALLNKMKDSGEVPEWVVDEIQSTYEASGLRTDLKETRDKYNQTLETNTRLRDTILESQFKSHGVTLSPKALRIPDDLDATDSDKVSGWLQEMGLVTAQPTTPTDERATHDRIANISSDATTPNQISVSDIQNMSEEEFWAKAPQIQEQLHTQR
jgi:hypothetical protein